MAATLSSLQDVIEEMPTIDICKDNEIGYTGMAHWNSTTEEESLLLIFLGDGEPEYSHKHLSRREISKSFNPYENLPEELIILATRISKK